MNIEQFEEYLKNWNNIQSEEELSERWKKCKYYIIKNASNFEERKTMDLLCNNYFWENKNRFQ